MDIHLFFFTAPVSACRPLSARMSLSIRVWLGFSQRLNQACNHTTATNDKWNYVLWSCDHQSKNNVGTLSHWFYNLTSPLKAWPFTSSSLHCENMYADALSLTKSKSLLASWTAEDLNRGVQRDPDVQRTSVTIWLVCFLGLEGKHW